MVAIRQRTNDVEESGARSWSDELTSAMAPKQLMPEEEWQTSKTLTSGAGSGQVCPTILLGHDFATLKVSVTWSLGTYLGVGRVS